MLDLLKADLTAQGAFDKQLPPIIERLIETVPNQTVPYRFKLLFALSEATAFATQFRRNIYHWEGFELPTNALSVGVAGSGFGKDSSINAIRRSFADAHKLISNRRAQLAKQHAIKLATDAGEEDPSDFNCYKKFYKQPPPMLITPTTPQGLIEHLNDMAELPLGAGVLVASELADELATNGQMADIMKTIAEVYDTGDKAVSYTKGKEHRSREVKSMPLSGLLVGSPDMLLYDEHLKRKFTMLFASKLARRSHFSYAPFDIPRKEYASVKAMIAEEKAATFQAKEAASLISQGTLEVAKYHIDKASSPLNTSEDLIELFFTYERYNYEIAESMSSTHQLSKLVRKHLQWKALKLAGVLAMFDMSEEVTSTNYLDAIRIVEYMDTDMQNFERQLNKESYEVFADYVKSEAKSEPFTIGLHELRKREFIPKQGNADTKMKELIKLAASYDRDGVYSVTEDSITYEPIVQTDAIGISFKPVDNTRLAKLISDGADKATISDEKSRIASGANTDIQFSQTEFANLSDLLSGDYAYSPFEFTDGIRDKAHLVPSTKWVVFDIDDSVITDEQASLILSEFNHHVCRTSDPSNAFKFRILIELDSIVELNAIEWKHFYLSIADELALRVDPLPQSAIFFSYSTSAPPISVLDASPLPVRDHLMSMKERMATKQQDKPITPAQSKALLADPLTTFAYAFEASQGARSRQMIRAAHHAQDLGMPNDDIVKLMYEINEYLVPPLESDRFERTVVNQITRWH